MNPQDAMETQEMNPVMPDHAPHSPQPHTDESNLDHVPDPLRPMYLRKEVLDAMVETVAAELPETGGLLGGRPGSDRVSRYYFDHQARTSQATFTPDIDQVNRILGEWDAEGDDFIGFVHSHPGHYHRLSPGDHAYARRLLQARPDLDRLFLPVAVFEGEGDMLSFVMRPYVVWHDEAGRLREGQVELVVVDEQGTECSRQAEVRLQVPHPGRKVKSAYEDGTFSRIADAVDLERMRNSRVVAVGAGGAAEYLEQLARSGLGQFVLLDPDVVSITNLATQQTYRRDVGRPKVDVLAERLRDINPDAQILAIQKSSDELDDAMFGRILTEPMGRDRCKPRVSVLCGLTDSFPAQARVSRLALQFAVPCLCAQVYEAGVGAEVSFTHPDLTPACQRCALSSRYQQYAEGSVREVGSAGTPIFATSRLNATKGFITLGLLHAGTDHPRWGKVLEPVAGRNLVLVRMHPSLKARLGLDYFDEVKTSDGQGHFDETLWTTVTPDDGRDGAHVCPDCQGKTKLRELAGTFADTRTGARCAKPKPFMRWVRNRWSETLLSPAQLTH